jgi:glycosyltransferase involved in cell wall biosynthesis
MESAKPRRLVRDTSESPEVSVVIPTRNRWRTLAHRGLRGAFAQQAVSVEVVVVDDGSDVPPPADGLFEDPRLQVVRHKRRAGAAAARNTGIRHAQAEWIAFLDDDDMWAPEKLSATLAAVRRAGADFGYSSALVLDAQSRPIQIVHAIAPERLSDALRRANALPAGASNVVAKGSLLDATGGFDEAFSATADWDLWFRLARAGRGAALAEVLVAYPEGSWLLDDEPRFREDCERLEEKHRGVSVDWRGYECWVADIYGRAGRRGDSARRYFDAWLRHRDIKLLLLAGGALVGRRSIERLRGVQAIEPPQWLSLYAGDP